MSDRVQMWLCEVCHKAFGDYFTLSLASLFVEGKFTAQSSELRGRSYRLFHSMLRMQVL